jgi:arabinogalactan oligomer/maltooligosaccharide transport system permease protein
MLISIFRGKLAFALKVITLLILSSLLVMLAQQALASGEYAIAIFLALSTVIINFVYLTKRSVPLKFFLPGLLFLLAFVIGPILYTLVMSGFTYQTGNTLSKPEAVIQLQKNSVQQDADQTIFDVTIGKNGANELSLLYFDSLTNEYAISTEKARAVEPESTIIKDEFDVPASSANFQSLTVDELGALDAQIPALKFYYNDEYYLGLEGFQAASIYKKSLQFDAASGDFKSLINNDIYRDNGRGNFANLNNPEDILEPGWRAPIWFENYTKLFTEERLRTPFIKVFIWTLIRSSEATKATA